MTLHNSLHTGSAAHQVLSALDARLALAGELAPSGPGALDVRLGVVYPCPGGFTVSGTSSTSPWQYSVPAATFVTSKGTLDGARLGSNDGVYLASTIAPPASNSRYDVVYALQQDADATLNPDATTAPTIAVYNGPASATPSLSAALAAIPAGAYALASALVANTATAGTSGAGVTITQQWQWTSLRGAPIPFRNDTEMNAVTWGSAAVPAIGLRLDLGALFMNVGSGWVPVASASAWTAYTPTVAAFSGSSTFGSIAGRYMQIGKTVIVNASATVTSVGTGTLAVNVSLPLPSTGSFYGNGRDGANGYGLLAQTSGSNALIVRYDGASPIVANAQLAFTVTYETS